MSPTRYRGSVFFYVFAGNVTHVRNFFLGRSLRGFCFGAQFCVRGSDRCIVSTERLKSAVLEFPVLPGVKTLGAYRRRAMSCRGFRHSLSVLSECGAALIRSGPRALPRKGVAVAEAGLCPPNAEADGVSFAPRRGPWMVDREEAHVLVTDGTARQH